MSTKYKINPDSESNKNYIACFGMLANMFSANQGKVFSLDELKKKYDGFRGQYSRGPIKDISMQGLMPEVRTLLEKEHNLKLFNQRGKGYYAAKTAKEETKGNGLASNITSNGKSLSVPETLTPEMFSAIASQPRKGELNREKFIKTALLWNNKYPGKPMNVCKNIGEELGLAHTTVYYCLLEIRKTLAEGIMPDVYWDQGRKYKMNKNSIPNSV